MNNERIDLTQFEGIMNIEWLFDEQLFVGEHNRWRFAINEYTDTETLSETDIEEWENGLESVWDSLTSGVACLPDLIAELKTCYERLDMANEAMLTAREVLMKHHEWMSLNDFTTEEEDQEVLDVVKDLREASE